MSQERYTPEEAMEEASRIKQKVGSGEAKTFSQAEDLVEKEKTPSVEGIMKYADDLRAKVEAAKLQREKDVEKKLNERDVMIAEAKRNEGLLITAQETFEYFTAMQELGELTDTSDVKKLNEIGTLVVELEKQRSEIDKKIGVIESRPEILDKLHDAAKKEDVSRTIGKEEKEARERLDPQIEQLNNSLKELAERKEKLGRQYKEQEQIFSRTWEKIDKSFEQAKNILGEKSKFGSKLDAILRRAYNKPPEEIQQWLSEARKSLGMLKGKEKAAIDYILSSTQEFGEYGKARDQLATTDQQFEAKDEEKGLAEKFKSIILSAWETQNKINELTGKDSDSLPFELAWNFAAHEQGNRLQKEISQNIKELAGGTDLIYTNPKAVRERE